LTILGFPPDARTPLDGVVLPFEMRLCVSGGQS
jgi:hypothetical protein